MLVRGAYPYSGGKSTIPAIVGHPPKHFYSWFRLQDCLDWATTKCPRRYRRKRIDRGIAMSTEAEQAEAKDWQ